MKLRLICVGKLSSPELAALARDYLHRLRRFRDLEIIEIKDAEGEAAARLAKEAAKIRAAAGDLRDCVLWDEGGEALDSRAFSRFLEKREGASAKRLTLIIGSSHGVDASLKADLPRKFQLGRFTFTHEWARALVLEQLYRAECIKRNIPYHH